MKRSARASTLGELVSMGALTPEGKNWLIEATDPFHDGAVTLTGMPDMNVAGSVIQCVKKTVTIAKPAGISANWDCNICMWPNPQQVPVSGGAEQNPNTYAAATTRSGYNSAITFGTQDDAGTITPYPIGGVTAFSTPPGAGTYGAFQATANTTDCNLSLDTSFMSGNSRLIAQGFEVTNTTAPLYRQGQVTVWRQPTNQPGQKYATTCYELTSTLAELRKTHQGRRLIAHHYLKERLRALEADTTIRRRFINLAEAMRMMREEIAQVNQYLAEHDIEQELRSKKENRKSVEPGPETISVNASGVLTTYAMSQPPSTQADAMLLAGSQQWNAEDGNYSVCTLNTLDNPAKFQEPQLIVVWTSSVDDSGLPSGLAMTTGVIDTGFIDDAHDVLTLGTNSLLIAPFNLSGAYYTGLSAQTTLSITAAWYVERFPDPFETDLVVLASPSPGFDAVAMDIYARSMRSLPVACKQGENPLGEWFRSVIGSVARTVAPALQAAGTVNPLMGGLGSLASAVGNDPYFAARPAKQKKTGGNRGTQQKPVQKNNQAKKKKVGRPPPIPPRGAAYQQVVARKKARGPLVLRQ